MDSIQDLTSVVRDAGERALRRQEDLKTIDREQKEDTTVITDVDHEVEQYMKNEISSLYPSAGIVAEESTIDPASEDAEYVFVIDPIDGTGVFSQGLEGWAVSVGVCKTTEPNSPPVAGIVYSPGLNLFLFADIDGTVESSGDFPALIPLSEQKEVSRTSTLMVSSRLHHQADWGRYKGRIRSLGSVALHMVSCLFLPAVAGAAEMAGFYAWDIAGAHAVLRSVSCKAEYYSGSTINYNPLLKGSETPQIILSGSPNAVGGLRDLIELR